MQKNATAGKFAAGPWKSKKRNDSITLNSSQKHLILKNKCALMFIVSWRNISSYQQDCFNFLELF